MLSNYFSKFTRCFYTLSKKVFNQSKNRNQPKIKAKKRFAYYRDICLLIYSSRVLLVFYVVHYGPKTLSPKTVKTFCQLDPIANVVHSNQQLYEPFIGLLVFLFALFDFTCQRAVYRLNTNSIVWRWWYEVIVVNQDAYYQSLITDKNRLETIYTRRESQFVDSTFFLNPSVVVASNNENIQNLCSIFKKTILKIKAKLYVLYNFEHVNKKVLFGRRLRIIPQLSYRVRACILRFLLLTEISSFFCLLLIVFLELSFLVKNLAQYRNPIPAHPWYSLVFVSVDVTLMLLGLIRMFQWALFFTNCVILGTIMFTGHAFDCYRQVENMLNSYFLSIRRNFFQKNRKKNLIIKTSKQSNFWMTLQFLGGVAANSLSEHNKICYIVIRGSIDFFGSVLIAFLCTHLPVNVFLLRRNLLTFGGIAISEVIPWVIVLFQALAAAIVFGPLAWCAKVYHHPKQYIPRLNMLLMAASMAQDKGGDHGNSHRWLLLQMKYDDLYGRLLQGPKIAINIGPVESITFRTALESFFIYFGFVLMAFSQILSANLRKQRELSLFV